MAKLLQRMPDELHERLKRHAGENGLSVNRVVNRACECYLAHGADRLPSSDVLAERHSGVDGVPCSTVAPESSSRSISSFSW